MRKLYISPPFGNYGRLLNAITKSKEIIPIVGTFTCQPRDGKFVKILKTLRYDYNNQGWVNKIGLCNPGI